MNKKGIFIPRNIFIIAIAVALCIYAATILGLVLGLKGAWYDKPKELSNHNNDASGNITISTNTTTPYPIITQAIKVQKSHRLPNNLKPFYYDLKIEAKFDPFTKPRDLNGDLRIDFVCDEATDKIVIHMANMTVFNDTLQVKGITQIDFEIKNIPWDYDTDFNFLTLFLNRNLIESHKYSLFIKYKANVQVYGGLYSRSYEDNQGREK
jgi:hypothetical protein